MARGLSQRTIVACARAGYAARGFVYVLVGALALMGAMGGDDATPDTRGALMRLLDQPFGSVLLGSIAIGLVAYALWRGIQAVFDTEHHGSELKAMVTRGAFLVSSVVHASLALWAGRAAIFALQSRPAAATHDSAEHGFAVWLMSQPLGRWLVLVVGVAIVVAGVIQVRRVLRGEYMRRLDVRATIREPVSAVSGFGIVARGVLFVIVGGLFVYAGIKVDPDQAGGVRTALAWLQQQRFGPILFVGMALGLFAFGLYGFIEAVWHRVDAERVDLPLDLAVQK